MLHHLIMSTTRLFCLGVALFIASNIQAQANLSDPIFYYYSDAELYENGYKAYQDNNFTEAALYLYAYAQRHREILDGPGSQEKAEFYSALVYTTRNLHAVAHQKSDDPFGREYTPLDKSYYDKKPNLPKTLSINEEKPAAQNKKVKFKVFAKLESGDEPLTGEAVVVRYDAQLHESGKAFKVTDIHTQLTGNGGKSPAEFTLLPGEMAYFEVYRSFADLKKVAKEKVAQKWTIQPFKNFGEDSTRLCKTNAFDINTPLKNACYSSLHLTCPKSDTEKAPENVDQQPIALFTTDKTACFPSCTIQCSNQSRNADRYVWAVDGKIVSREKDFSFTIKEIRGHTLKLTAYKGNLSDEYEVSVRGLGE